MTHIVEDRVLETSTTTGTGNFALAGAVTGYRDFDSVMADGDTCSYLIEAVDGSGVPTGEWETGVGTFNDTDTLVRTTVFRSSNANALVNFSAGTKRVAISVISSTLSGQLLNVQVFTSGSGTYVPTAGTTNIVLEMVGGGGGGAGIASPGGSNGSRGASGGGGAYLMKCLTADFSGGAYSVGAAGSGGSAGANSGTAGGDTTFTDTAGSPTVYTAGGGAAGTTQSAAAPVDLGVGVAGGTATNGDLNISGGASCPTIVLRSTGDGYSGNGGISHFSAGAPPSRINGLNASVAGNTAAGFGGGGGAAYGQGTGVARAGGNGSSGIIIIWEYMAVGGAVTPPAVPSGTSFPSSPTTSERFFRTDRGIEYYYDGTRWLSTQLFVAELRHNDGNLPITGTSFFRGVNPWAGTYALYAERVTVNSDNTAATPASNYFTYQFSYLDAASSTAIGSSLSSQNDTINTWFAKTSTAGVVVPSTSESFMLTATETGAASTYAVGAIIYRLVG